MTEIYEMWGGMTASNQGKQRRCNNNAKIFHTHIFLIRMTDRNSDLIYQYIKENIQTINAK